MEYIFRMNSGHFFSSPPICLVSWQKYWLDNQIGRHYLQFDCVPKWKPKSLKVSKWIWATITQLKLGHGYFRSYLVRLPDWNSADCQECGCEENPGHLLLKCSRFKEERTVIKQELNIELVNMKFLFNTKSGLEFTVKFIEKTRLATRGWLEEVEKTLSQEEP